MKCIDAPNEVIKFGEEEAFKIMYMCGSSMYLTHREQYGEQCALLVAFNIICFQFKFYFMEILKQCSIALLDDCDKDMGSLSLRSVFTDSLL